MRTIHSRMTPLRQRMLEDLQLRNYSPQTIRCYLRCIADFAKHFGVSPAHLGPEQVRTYQLFLVQDKQVSWTSVVQTVCALRFFYRITLGRPAMLEYIPHPQRPFTLPTLTIAGSFSATAPLADLTDRSQPACLGRGNSPLRFQIMDKNRRSPALASLTGRVDLHG